MHYYKAPMTDPKNVRFPILKLFEILSQRTTTTKTSKEDGLRGAPDRSETQICGLQGPTIYLLSRSGAAPDPDP